jgi:hypothetical protein
VTFNLGGIQSGDIQESDIQSGDIQSGNIQSGDIMPLYRKFVCTPLAKIPGPLIVQKTREQLVFRFVNRCIVKNQSTRVRISKIQLLKRDETK